MTRQTYWVTGAPFITSEPPATALSGVASVPGTQTGSEKARTDTAKRAKISFFISDFPRKMRHGGSWKAKSISLRKNSFRVLWECGIRITKGFPGQTMRGNGYGVSDGSIPSDFLSYSSPGI